jgi:hypothetical protein
MPIDRTCPKCGKDTHEEPVLDTRAKEIVCPHCGRELMACKGYRAGDWRRSAWWGKKVPTAPLK